MLKKNLDEYLYLSGQKSAIEELDRMEGQHEFSSDYKKQKKELLDSLFVDEAEAMEEETMSNTESMWEKTEKGKMDTLRKESEMGGRAMSKKHRKWSKQAVAAAMLLVMASLSVTTYAAGKYWIETKEAKGNIMRTNSNLGETGDTLTVKKLSFAYGYIPEGYEEWQPRYYSKGGKIGGEGFYVIQWQGEDSVYNYVENHFETTIQGKQAYCYEMGEENKTERKAIQIVYDDEGAIYKLVSDSDDISMDELIQIAENLTVSETGDTLTFEKTERDISTYGDYEELRNDEKAEIAASLIHEIGDTVQMDKVYISPQGKRETELFEVTLNSLEVTDDLTGLDPQYFDDYDEHIAPFTDENGQFLAYTGIWDAGNESGIYEMSEQMGFKVIRASFTVTNTSDHADGFWAGDARIGTLTENEGQWYFRNNYGTMRYKNRSPVGYDDNAVYFDCPQNTSGDRSDYYFINMEAGETVHYNLAFIVFEDEMDNLCLRFGNTGGDVETLHCPDGDPEKKQTWFWKIPRE